MKQQETAAGDGDKARQQGIPDRATGADEQGQADHERAGQPQQPARRRADHHRRDQGKRGGRRGRSDEAAAQTSFFLNFSAVALSRSLVTKLSRTSPSWSTARQR